MPYTLNTRILAPLPEPTGDRHNEPWQPPVKSPDYGFGGPGTNAPFNTTTSP